MTKYHISQEVNWLEGRTRRPKYGLIEAVHEVSSGWPPEYTVRAFKKNGVLGKLTRRLYESELEPVKPDFIPDNCCSCHESLNGMLVCNNCYSSVCVGCAQHDGADDSYCPECWTDLHAFLAEGEGVSNGNEAPPAHGRHSAGLSAPMSDYEQKQL